MKMFEWWAVLPSTLPFDAVFFLSVVLVVIIYVCERIEGNKQTNTLEQPRTKHPGTPAPCTAWPDRGEAKMFLSVRVFGLNK